MANIDRILNIHQSFTQEKISVYNKEILKAIYGQSKIISQIQKELEIANATSKAILSNQIKDLQQKEEQKYYKAISFITDELIDFISFIDSPILKTFIFNLYSPVINTNIEESIKCLIEIPDKMYCSQSLKKVQNIKSELLQFNADYEHSPFAQLIEQKKDFDNLKSSQKVKEYYIKYKYLKKAPTFLEKYGNQEILPLKNSLRTFGIYFFAILLCFSIFLSVVAFQTDTSLFIPVSIIFIFPPALFLFILIKKDRKWRRNYENYFHQYQKDQKRIVTENTEQENLKQNEISQNSDLNGTHQYIKIIKEADSLLPNWKGILEEADHIYSKMVKPMKKDSLLCEVARFAFLNPQGLTIRKVSEKFSISMNRANTIFNQLRLLGILESYPTRKIAYKSPFELEMALYEDGSSYIEPSLKYFEELKKRSIQFA
jgi:hypothetical protein